MQCRHCTLPNRQRPRTSVAQEQRAVALHHPKAKAEHIVDDASLDQLVHHRGVAVAQAEEAVGALLVDLAGLASLAPKDDGRARLACNAEQHKPLVAGNCGSKKDN